MQIVRPDDEQIGVDLRAESLHFRCGVAHCEMADDLCATLLPRRADMGFEMLLGVGNRIRWRLGYAGVRVIEPARSIHVENVKHGQRHRSRHPDGGRDDTRRRETGVDGDYDVLRLFSCTL